MKPGDTPDDEMSADLVRILGRVQEIDKSGEGEYIVVVDGVRITITPNTKVAGEPEIGAGALAVVRKRVGEVVTAVSIIFTRPGRRDLDETGPGPVTETPEGGKTQDDDPAGSGDSSSGSDTSNDNPGNIGSSNVATTTIIVERINGRMVVADGRLFLLKADQIFGLRTGDTITVQVHRVERRVIENTLSFAEMALVRNNPLYLESNSTIDNALYVAQ